MITNMLQSVLSRLIMPVRRFQYATGLLRSRLRRGRYNADAPYRAVVYGLPNEMWHAFDMAFPEYEKVFAHDNCSLAELRGQLGKRHMAFIVFSEAPTRRVNLAIKNLNPTVFHLSMAPVPILELSGTNVHGFVLDSIGSWIGARRPTELDLFLGSLDLSDRHATVKTAAGLLKKWQISSVKTDKVLIVPQVKRSSSFDLDVAELDDGLLALLEGVTEGNRVIFSSHVHDAWYSEAVLADFIHKVQDCRAVYVNDSPLGFIALLLGKEVHVSGRPFWAGYGQTECSALIHRMRPLETKEIVAISVLILTRYVTSEGERVQLTSDYALPSGFISTATDS
ncbi:hypothetical protein Q4544_15540 [Cognatishimia sp. 1_MG-2023]|uniref:capsular polysaccharide export protein, LipB/KpsS family n=1 Tax=Cognatishimia sp. 1_MG-2023 TaxID=3062642 RepID=UPI0026E12086|nr:hypothetical protein [Cognatishimia sp. 1_MG-2023]MDO6728353.1 hypothetical protein [Cognatishimia sp. 1_MG-2023]